MANFASEWRFDGSGVADGGIATTSYTQNNWIGGSCTIGGSPIVKSGSNCINGSCLQFNGSTDYLDCGNSSQLNMSSGGITISAWIKRGVTGTTQRILHKGGQSNLYYDYHLLFSGDALLFGAVKTTTTTSGIMTTATYTSTSNWYYIVGTYDGSNYFVYINGILQASSASSGISNTSINNLYIGERNDGTQIFNGLIDEVRIYNAAMPTSQIEEQYYAGLNNLLINGSIDKEEYVKILASK